MLLEISGIAAPPEEGAEKLRDRIAAVLGVPVERIGSLKVIRRSMDARRRRPPRFVYVLEASLPDDILWTANPADGVTIRPAPEKMLPSFPRMTADCRLRPVVIGCGPAGLFAALTLARRGKPPLLLERGKKADERVADVRRFWNEGLLDPESHVHFGEGGAGTFSDGKLTSRAGNPHAGWVKQVLVEMGAPAGILTDSRPHIGTDRLREVVVRLRGKLCDLGCEVRFGARVTDFLTSRGRIAGVAVNFQEEVRTDRLILAIGQSADDTYRLLQERGVRMEPKPFAIGLRVEHPQELINEIQYGKWHRNPALPPADYSLTARVRATSRSVYTFCMCPGGQVIGCSAEPGGVVTNGMSRSRRDGLYANSAVVVNVQAGDFQVGAPLGGLDFRKLWEAEAFLQGGGNYCAPAQRLTDFLDERDTGLVGSTSFLPGVRAVPLKDVLPRFVGDSLKEGLWQFDRKMPGFVTAEAHLIGVETRTSSPVRILRGADGRSVTVSGLYPCGEGAGYAGGIVSSALDGIRTALGVA
jgi:uncharacterized FAD-dependent dehydrogenase